MGQPSYVTGTVNKFQWPDYLLFALLLVVSAGIGLFYAFKDRKRQNTKDFLLAGGNMPSIPVALSLLASFMSAITLLGTPSEMYKYTTMYWYIGAGYFLTIAAATHLYIPIFYRLKVTSSYEYLGMRFGRTTRTIAAIIYIVQMVLYMAIVLYAPSLAISAVTDFPLWGAVWAVGLVCIFYTTIGGMKAVLWTDTFQVGMMMAGLLAVLIKGSIEVGGFAKAWEIAYANSRVIFDDFDPDPAVRHSFWTCFIGGGFTWLAVYGTNQAQVQRSITCPTLRKAQLAYWLNFPGLCIILYVCCLIGIVLYAYYSVCDPLKFGLITASDQLLPLFVMDVLGNLPGVPGLFVSCLFSGALSTLSSGLNSIAAVFLADVVKVFCIKDISEKKATILSKILGLVFGFVCLGLTYVASMLGGVLQAALALFGVIGGPLLGVYTLGMFFPWANEIGAAVGTVSSLTIMLWISVGYQVWKPKVATLSPVSITGCNWNLTTTTTAATTSFIETSTAAVTTGNPLDRFYSLSYLWYSATAMALVVGIGMIVSLITGRTDPKTLDSRLCCPFFDIVFPFLPKKWRKKLRFGVDYEKHKHEVHEEYEVKVHEGHIDKPHIYQQNEKMTNGVENPAFDKRGQLDYHL